MLVFFLLPEIVFTDQRFGHQIDLLLRKLLKPVQARFDLSVINVARNQALSLEKIVVLIRALNVDLTLDFDRAADPDNRITWHLDA